MKKRKNIVITSYSIHYTKLYEGSQLDSCITLIGTGDYTDVMDMSFYSNAGSVTELYQDGIALDLTPYRNNFV